jgi:hypothetical protein
VIFTAFSCWTPAKKCCQCLAHIWICHVPEIPNLSLSKHGIRRVAIKHQHICHATFLLSDGFHLHDPGASCSATIWGATRNECSDISVWGVDCLAHVSIHPKDLPPSHIMWHVRWECAVPKCMEYFSLINDICSARVNVISWWAGWNLFAAWWNEHIQWLQPLDGVATYHYYKCGMLSTSNCKRLIPWAVLYRRQDAWPFWRYVRTMFDQ